MFKFGSRALIAVLALSLLVFMLAGCDGGGILGGGGALGGGGGGKAALTGSSIAVTSSGGAPMGDGTLTNGQITLNLTTTPTSSDYPLKFVVTGGSLVLKPTNKPFLGELRAMVLESNTNINITAFTTLHAHMYDKASGKTPLDRYNAATKAMTGFFKMMGVNVGANVDFLNDNPYSGSNSVAYETAQQLLAYMCAETDGTGLKNIGTKLKAFAYQYMDGLKTGAAAGNIATLMNTNLGLPGGTITNPGQISGRLNSDEVKAAVAQSVVTAFDNDGIEGTGTVPTENDIESAVAEPTGFATDPMYIAGNGLAEIEAGAAGDTKTTGVLLVKGPTDNNLVAETMTVEWPDDYTGLPADFVTYQLNGAGPVITVNNGDTIPHTANVTFKFPDESNYYEVDIYATSNPDAILFFGFETLGNDEQTVTTVEMLNSGSATSTAGVGFNTVSDTRIADIGTGAEASISGKLSANVVTVSPGAGTATDYIVNFLAPEGIRFIRDGGNYPNYAIIRTITGGGTTAVACPATTIRTDGVEYAGLADFGVEVLTDDESYLAEDYLDNGMYLINTDYQNYIAALQDFKYAGSATASSANLQLNGSFTGICRTWGSLAGTSAAVNADPSTLYDAPYLSLIPGTDMAGRGLTGNSGTSYANDLDTTWTIAGKASGSAGTFAGNAAWYLKPATGNGLTNTAKMWLVIPAKDLDDPDVVSDNPVTVTVP